MIGSAKRLLQADNLYFNKQDKFTSYTFMTIQDEQALSDAAKKCYMQLKHELMNHRRAFQSFQTSENAIAFVLAYEALAVFKKTHRFTYASVLDFINNNLEIMQQAEEQDLQHPASLRQAPKKPYAGKKFEWSSR